MRNAPAAGSPSARWSRISASRWTAAGPRRGRRGRPRSPRRRRRSRAGTPRCRWRADGEVTRLGGVSAFCRPKSRSSKDTAPDGVTNRSVGGRPVAARASSSLANLRSTSRIRRALGQCGALAAKPSRCQTPGYASPAATGARARRVVHRRPLALPQQSERAAMLRETHPASASGGGGRARAAYPGACRNSRARTRADLRRATICIFPAAEAPQDSPATMTPGVVVRNGRPRRARRRLAMISFDARSMPSRGDRRELTLLIVVASAAQSSGATSRVFSSECCLRKWAWFAASSSMVITGDESRGFARRPGGAAGTGGPHRAGFQHSPGRARCFRRSSMMCPALAVANESRRSALDHYGKLRWSSSRHIVPPNKGRCRYVPSRRTSWRHTNA